MLVLIFLYLLAYDLCFDIVGKEAETFFYTGQTYKQGVRHEEYIVGRLVKTFHALHGRHGGHYYMVSYFWLTAQI